MQVHLGTAALAQPTGYPDGSIAVQSDGGCPTGFALYAPFMSGDLTSEAIQSATKCVPSGSCPPPYVITHQQAFTAMGTTFPETDVCSGQLCSSATCGGGLAVQPAQPMWLYLLGGAVVLFLLFKGGN